MEDILFTFHNTHHSILAEKILLEANIPVKVMPMPEVITAGCGLCLRLPEADGLCAYHLLKSSSISPRGIYRKNSGLYVELQIETLHT
ncbi:DUF3343 domain-containing protein [Lacrimispora algidixylanolytica]|uniref:Putative Se/S carrier protein-like domain-containing protein n=1 Tax=Lacrimispora algidixylanolytica TaxID=94868 RepID=A0A419SVN6_9FIRM|nr:DUF3343 domain-containing protein [Lacrimispora algidixylanolytica]RKD29282.1 hypothetical protein BET01_07960 [Lacrimispora algidixylanolytica]